MKNFAFLSLLIILISTPVVFGKTYTDRYAYNYQNPQAYNYYRDDIGYLEQYLWNKNYARNNNLARLEKLERQAFGAIQQGDFETRLQNVRSAILSRPKQNYKTSVLRSIGDYFSGQATGFTPPINQYPYTQPYTNQPYTNSYYFPNFGRSNEFFYSTPYGRGYQMNNSGRSSGMGVRILN